MISSVNCVRIKSQWFLKIKSKLTACSSEKLLVSVECHCFDLSLLRPGDMSSVMCLS